MCRFQSKSNIEYQLEERLVEVIFGFPFYVRYILCACIGFLFCCIVFLAAASGFLASDIGSGVPGRPRDPQDPRGVRIV